VGEKEEEGRGGKEGGREEGKGEDIGLMGAPLMKRAV
jgi:hypothetical protein